MAKTETFSRTMAAICSTPRGTTPEELKATWNYEDRLCESAEVEDGYAIVLYLLNNEYSVSLVMHEEDLPETLRKELED